MSPVVEVTANTSLSALPPQYGIRSQLSQHTHTCSYAHTCHACIVWRGMTSPHTHTNTPKQLQRGESPGPAGTDGVSWDLTACPAAPKSHTHIQTHKLRGHSKVSCAYQYDLKKNQRHLRSGFIKASQVQFSVPLWLCERADTNLSTVLLA